MSVAALSISRQHHIVVDLDGTLVLTDTFAASLLEAVRRRPSCLPALLGTLLRGTRVLQRRYGCTGRAEYRKFAV